MFSIVVFSLFAALLAIVSCSKNERKAEVVVHQPKTAPKTPVTPRTRTLTPARTPATRTAESNVKTPVSVSRSHRTPLMKPDPTQKSMEMSREKQKTTQNKLVEHFMMETFEDQIDDDTLDDAQSLKGVNLDIRSDSFPLAKKEKLKRQGRGETPAVPFLGPKRSLDRMSLMKEDVTAEDTDVSVRETKKKLSGILGRTKSLDIMRTKTKDETVVSDKKKAKSILKQKTLATEKEHQREKKRKTIVERRKKSRENKSREKSEDKSREKKAAPGKSVDKLNKSLAVTEKQFIPSAECYKGQ